MTKTGTMKANTSANAVCTDIKQKIYSKGTSLNERAAEKPHKNGDAETRREQDVF